MKVLIGMLATSFGSVTITIGSIFSINPVILMGCILLFLGIIITLVEVEKSK